MGYFPAFICENGHEISTNSNACLDKFCTECGAPVISKCPSCGKTIRGISNGDYGFLCVYHVPAYCPDCGQPYPWTKTAIQATIDMLAEDEDYPEQDRERLVEVIPDIISETPKTKLAAVRVKKALNSLGSFAAEGLRSFLIDFGCEFVKSQIGL